MKSYSDAVAVSTDLRKYSTKEVADTVLTSVATVSLIASLCDGSVDQREVNLFMKNFRDKFLLTQRKARQIVGKVIMKMHSHRQETVLDDALQILISYLDKKELLDIFEAVSDIVLADGKIHEGEEQFMDYLAVKLDIVEELKGLYADEVIAENVVEKCVKGGQDIVHKVEKYERQKALPIMQEEKVGISHTTTQNSRAAKDAHLAESSHRVLFTLLSPTGRAVVEISSD